MNKKVLAMVLAVILLMTAAISGTIAWLTDTTDPVQNTFTVGKVKIELDESDVDDSTPDEDRDTANSYKMVPGTTLQKDPTVTVEKGSEACWVFVKVEKINDPDNYLSYTITTPWKAVPNAENVHYIKQAALTASDAVDAEYGVLNGNKVTVRTNVTKGDMETLKATYDAAEQEEEGTGAATLPQLKFTAYAIQSDNLDYEGKTDEAEQAAIAWGYITTP